MWGDMSKILAGNRVLRLYCVCIEVVRVKLKIIPNYMHIITT